VYSQWVVSKFLMPDMGGTNIKYMTSAIFSSIVEAMSSSTAGKYRYKNHKSYCKRVIDQPDKLQLKRSIYASGYISLWIRTVDLASETFCWYFLHSMRSKGAMETEPAILEKFRDTHHKCDMHNGKHNGKHSLGKSLQDQRSLWRDII
jgi:hypothetical protein